MEYSDFLILFFWGLHICRLVQSYAWVQSDSISRDDGTVHYTKHYVSTSYPITGLDRPLWLQEVEAPRISRQSAHEGVRSSWDIPSTHFYQRMSRPQGHSAARRKPKIPAIPSEIKPKTVWLEAQCLNQLRNCIHLLCLLWQYFMVKNISASTSTNNINAARSRSCVMS